MHTVTTKPWPLEKAIDAYQAAGVSGISIWRDAVEGHSLPAIRRRLDEAGLAPVSYVRGGFFASTTAEKRQRAIDENRRILEEANALGAPLVVLVCGSDPDQSLGESRAQIQLGIEALLPEAEAAGVRLGIEPLHPMYADTRSAVVTLGQANDMAGAIDSPYAGIVLDVYHVWWDATLNEEIERCAQSGRLFAFHVCDWRVPTTDFLNDRGIMGEGCIPIRAIRACVERQEYTGFIEVEIFSERYWRDDQQEFLDRVIAGYLSHT
jgi:sugar phosphate isomerase/epimerase